MGIEEWTDKVSHRRCCAPGSRAGFEIVTTREPKGATGQYEPVKAFSQGASRPQKGGVGDGGNVA